MFAVVDPSADRLTLHVDGQLAAETAAPDAGSYQLDSDAPLRLGHGTNGPFNGRLLDVRIYSRTLNADESQALADQRPNGFILRP